MPRTMAELTRLLDLEEIEIGLFRGAQPDTQLQRAFGGQVLAQALMAAARTAPANRPIHSLHAYFLRPGRTTMPIIYDVEQTRDGGSFSSRRVIARQSGQVIFNLAASFHIREDGYDHADRMPADITAPEDCPAFAEVREQITGESVAAWQAEFGVLDVRIAGTSMSGGSLAGADHPARARIWVRLGGPLRVPPGADVGVWNCAALAYASDLTLLSASLIPHLTGRPRVQMASLDHSMWFHRPFRADRWLLYDQVSPSASGAVGLSIGRLFQDGALVASVAQEGLIRPLS